MLSFRKNIFDKPIENIIKEIGDAKILIYGAGKLFNIARKSKQFKNLNIIAISDKKFINSKEKSFYDIPICDPNHIKDLEYDKILITTEIPSFVIKDLLNIYNVDKNKIKILKENKIDSVRLEACSICQLKCKCCDVRNPAHVIGINYLKFKNFKSFLLKNKEIKTIELSNNGEIFLNPELKEIIKYAYKKKVKLTAYNGVNLNTVKDDVLEALVKYKFEGLTCSIDGASQETYSKYRIGGDFDKVISNIKKINYYKEKYKSKFPKLKYQYIIFGHNEHEIPKAKILAKELDMEIYFKLNWSEDFSPVKDQEFVKNETGLSAVSMSEFLAEENKDYYNDVCAQLWTNPQINWDGRLFGCCIALKKDFGVNVFEVGLDNSLHSEKYMYAKKMLTGKAKGREDIVCTECPVYKDKINNNSMLDATFFNS